MRVQVQHCAGVVCVVEWGGFCEGCTNPWSQRPLEQLSNTVVPSGTAIERVELMVYAAAEALLLFYLRIKALHRGCISRRFMSRDKVVCLCGANGML